MPKARQLPYIDPDASLFVHAAVSIGTRLDELIRFEQYLDDAGNVSELHQMRIAAKRLRYTMDLFASAFTDYSRYGEQFIACVNQVKALQEHLGDIHDADVLAPRLTAQLHKMLAPAIGKDRDGEPRVGVQLVDYDGCQGLLTLCLETRSARDAALTRLRELWADLRAHHAFDGLRKLLRSAITDETLATALHEELPATQTPPSAEVTTPRKAPSDAPGEPANEDQTESRNGRSAPAARTRARSRASGSG